MLSSGRGVFRVTRKRSNYPVWHLHWRCNHIPVTLTGPAPPGSHHVLWAVKTCSDVWSSTRVLSWTRVCPRNHNLASETSTTLYTHNPTDCNTLTEQIGQNRFIFPDEISEMHFHWTTCNNQGNLNRQIASRVTHYVDEWYNLRFMTICNIDTLQNLSTRDWTNCRMNFCELSQFVILLVLTLKTLHFPVNYSVPHFKSRNWPGLTYFRWKLKVSYLFPVFTLRPPRLFSRMTGLDRLWNICYVCTRWI